MISLKTNSDISRFLFFRTQFVLVVAALLLDILMPSAAVALQDNELKNKLQAIVDDAVGEDCPGMVAAILQDGELVCNVASGLRRIGEPENELMPNDKMHLGSCTKAMTATLVGILVDEGKLSWDETISNRLPEIADDIDPVYRDVTLWQLLTHRGAVISNGAAWNKGGVNSHENRLEIAKLGLAENSENRRVGDFHYSNLGYMLAGLFIESAMDESWETLMQEKLFTPLGMNSAGFGPPDDQVPATQPWGHRASSDALIPIAFDNPPSISPAGRVHCNVSDWAKFVALHMDMECEKYNLLKPVTMAKLHTAYRGEGIAYSAGWMVGNDAEWIAHSGSNTLWYSTVRAFPKNGKAVLVVSNGPLITNQQIVAGVEKLILELIE